MRKIYVLLFSLIISLPTFSQATDYVIGTGAGSNGGTGYPTPFANWYWGNRQQYLILASEMQAAGASKGDITEIAFNVLNVNAVPALQGYTVWVKTTSSTGSLTQWETNMGSPVYGPVTYTASAGWNTFSFPEISWNGSDNIIIEVCSQNSSYISNGNASVEWATGLPFNASRTYRADASGVCGNPGNSNQSPTNRPLIRFRIEPPFANDASAAELIKPGAAICDNSKDIAVSILNGGTGNLNTAEISWTVIRNGVAFPTTTYNWSGNLAPNTASNSTTVGTFAPGFENGDIIKFWTANPNGVPDSSADQDTVSIQIREGISGVYNVGGIFDIDFPTLDLATNFADSFGAVCDSLIFNVRDGVYYGHHSINDIVNTSANSPIIFRAENGAAANVVFLDTTSTSADNYVFKVNMTNHVYFENINFVNNSKGNARRAVELAGYSEGVSFFNCSFENNYSGTSTSDNYALLYTDDYTWENDLHVTGSKFMNGSYAIITGGRNIDTTESGLMLHNNIFENQVQSAISIGSVSDIEISNNHIYSNSTNISSSNGILVDGNKGGLNISNNTIGGSGWPSTGINIQFSAGIPAKRANITNNSIAIGDSSGANMNGVLATGVSFADFIHNSVRVNGNESSSSALKIDGGGANRVVNNNLANFAGGVASNYQEVAGFPVFESDHNNFYSTGQFVTQHKNNSYLTVGQWASNIGDDQNSVSINPGFFSDYDLHACSDAMNNLGKPMPLVMYDLDGDMRSSTTPDIGADEYSSVGNLDLGKDTVVCKGTEIALIGALNYNDFYTAWSTGDSTASITVSQPGVYSVISENICGLASDTIVIGLSPAASLGNDTNICAQQTITLDANVANSTYSWNTGETSKTKTANSAGIYSVTVTDVNNCATRDTIFITQSEEVDLPNDTSLCGGASVFLDPKTGPGTYSWSTGQNLPIILANTSGTYSVTFTDIFGCTSTGSVDVISTTIPDAQFSVASMVANTVVFAANPYPNAMYSWDFGDGDTSNLQNPTHLYNPPGNYVVTLQITNDCGADFSSQEVPVNVSVNEFGTNNNVVFYPNPTKGIVNIMTQEMNSYQLRIESLEGKLVHNENYVGLNKVVDLSNFGKGVYLITIQSDKEKLTKRLILE